MIAVRRWILALVLGVVAACSSDGGTGPVAGLLTVTLATPNSGQDGSLMLALAGPETPVAVSPAAGLALWGGPVTAAKDTIVLTGTLSAGPILTLEVSDVGKAGQYGVTVLQVAHGTTYALRALTGYSATVTK